MSALKALRLVAFVEGISFLLLLLVAMPLKYFFAMPLAVRIVGSAHGVLFLLFLIAVFRAAGEHEWPLKRSFMAFVASLVPGGTFFLDVSLKKEMARLASEDRGATGKAPREEEREA